MAKKTQEEKDQLKLEKRRFKEDTHLGNIQDRIVELEVLMEEMEERVVALEQA